MIFRMKKSLVETNPYLKDPNRRKRLLRRSLVSSFAIEEIQIKNHEADVVKEEPATFTTRRTSTSGR